MQDCQIVTEDCMRDRSNDQAHWQQSQKQRRTGLIQQYHPWAIGDEEDGQGFLYRVLR